MGAVRCSLGRGTTAEDIEYVIESVVPLVGKLKAQSPAAGSSPVVGSSPAVASSRV
jgi:cysteine sulfinate desulfinase/cysteine desulfurase-like protein